MKINQIVVIKYSTIHYNDDIENEANILKNIRHDNIVKIRE